MITVKKKLFQKTRMAIVMAFATICSFALTPSQWLERAKGDETMVRYYGLLLDQDGRPVRGARVCYKIKRVALVVPLETRGSVKTGRDGRFTIRGIRRRNFTFPTWFWKGMNSPGISSPTKTSRSSSGKAGRRSTIPTRKSQWCCA